MGRPRGKPKSKSNTSYRKPIGLSVNLTQTLRKSLYLGLDQYSSYAQLVSTSRDHDIARDHLLSPPRITPSLSSLSCVSVRNVRMLPGELIGHIFSSENGLIPKPLSQGRMLLLTNQRVIGFGKSAGVRETFIIPLEEIKAVVVNAGQRSKGTLFQGSMMIVSAALFYVILAYWLTGRIDGPQVPIIRMDLVAFIIFLAVLIGVTVLAQMYFTKPDGEVLFQGDGVKFIFPFKGETSNDEMCILINSAFDGRHEIVS